MREKVNNFHSLDTSRKGNQIVNEKCPRSPCCDRREWKLETNKRARQELPRNNCQKFHASVLRIAHVNWFHRSHHAHGSSSDTCRPYPTLAWKGKESDAMKPLVVVSRFRQLLSKAFQRWDPSDDMSLCLTTVSFQLVFFSLPETSFLPSRFSSKCSWKTWMGKGNMSEKLIQCLGRTLIAHKTAISEPNIGFILTFPSDIFPFL